MIAVTGVIALVICAVNFAGGYLITGRFKRESSQMLGQKNTTFALYLALQYASGEAALATVFYVLYHNLWNSIQLAFVRERKPGSADIDPAADAER
jgi:BASS family bile acid:Na+ symporter